MSRSNLVNGLSKTETVANYTPWWKPALVGLNAAIGILTAGTAVLYVLSEIKSRKGVQ